MFFGFCVTNYFNGITSQIAVTKKGTLSFQCYMVERKELDCNHCHSNALLPHPLS